MTELWISTRAFLVRTPDSIAKVVSLENRAGRVKCSAQLSSGSESLHIKQKVDGSGEKGQ